MEKEHGEKLLMAAAGILVGAANGFFGGGGGMILVPVFVFLLRKSRRKAHATALFAILPVTVVSGLVYATYGSFLPSAGIPAGIGAVIGGAVGAVALGKIKNRLLSAVFILIMLAAGIKSAFF